VREGRARPDHGRPLHELHRRGRGDQPRPLDAEGHGHDLRTFDARRARVPAGPEAVSEEEEAWPRRSPATSSCRSRRGRAAPAPPVGPALGQQGVNIMDFCKNFNAKTASQKGLIIPVVITVYADRSYTFITKTPPASILLLKAAGVPKGSGTPNKEKVGKVTKK